MLTQHAELSEFGQLFAETNASESIVARIALQGYTGEWPDQHVHTAIESCNALGSATAGLTHDDPEGYARRCGLCEGLEYPGLSHNPEAPYCTVRTNA